MSKVTVATVNKALKSLGVEERLFNQGHTSTSMVETQILGTLHLSWCHALTA